MAGFALMNMVISCADVLRGLSKHLRFPRTAPRVWQVRLRGGKLPVLKSSGQKSSSSFRFEVLGSFICTGWTVLGETPLAVCLAWVMSGPWVLGLRARQHASS